MQCWLVIFGFIFVLGSCAQKSIDKSATKEESPVDQFKVSPALKIAVIGDFGFDALKGGDKELALSQLVKGWKPDYVFTVGDNNYPSGEMSTIDQNIGKYFSEYIYPYQGKYPSRVSEDKNRFFPALGNHDWNCKGCVENKRPFPHLDYFQLPGNERWYDVVLSQDVHAFVLDSDPRIFSKEQEIWLKSALQKSNAKFKLVFLHHPPYSSGLHGNQKHVQLPYKQWGASAVFAGHDHMYERIEHEGLPYFVVGNGAKDLYPIKAKLSHSQYLENKSLGAVLLRAKDGVLTVESMTLHNKIIDTYTMGE